MGFFDFVKGIGKKVGLGREAEDIKEDIVEALGGRVENLVVEFNDGTVTLRGTVDSQATREKAVLLAGNVKSVENVNDELAINPPEPDAEAEVASEPVFYTVKSGDSLWKIASAHYGDANKWQALFEANREVIKDPDLIYPGQQIRVPKL